MPVTTPELKAQYIALVEGRHSDAFSILGPHTLGDSTVVRTFQPYAESVVMKNTQGDSLGSMQKCHESGLYELTVEGTCSNYRLEITTTMGNTYQSDDPYRFASPLGELDLHLLGEGAHHTLYEKLGAHVLTNEG